MLQGHNTRKVAYLGDDHLIPRGGGGGWHFLEINILTFKMLKKDNLSSSGKKLKNLTSTSLELGERL